MRIKSILVASATFVSVTLAIPLFCCGAGKPIAGASQALNEAHESVIIGRVDSPTSYDWKTGYATTAVRIRELPSTDSAVVGNLYINDKVNYFKLKDEWYAIQRDDHIYYAASEYISEDPVEVVIENMEVTDEVDELARLVDAENGVNGYTAMLYTGSVVLNRMEHPRYSDTIHGVIYDVGQYECVTNGHIYREPSELAIQVAKELLTTGSVLPSNVIYQAEFTQGDGIYCTVGNTYFCYEN